MDIQTLVNILVEIAQLEALQVQARQKIQDNLAKSSSLDELRAEYRADEAEAVAGSKEQARTLRVIEQEIKSVEARILDRDDRLIGVSDGRGHRALTEEISSLKLKLGQLEDEAMELLDAEEQGQKVAEQVAKESLDRRTAAKSSQKEMGSESQMLTERLEHIEADMHRLLTMLPVTERRHVKRLRTKLDLSTVYLHNGACCGCFHQLPVQEAINVNRGRHLVRCPSCMRFVVHKPWK